MVLFFFFFQAEDGIRDVAVTGVQTCALPISCQGEVGFSEHRPCPASPPLEPADALDVDDVPDLADRPDDVLELVKVGDLDHEVVDAPAVIGDGDLGLGDVAVTRRDRSGDLGQQSRAIPADIDGDLDGDRKSTRLNSSHGYISYAVFCLKKKK